MENIKWGNKELPGLPQEKLEKLTYTKLVAREKALALSADKEVLKKRGRSISKANKGRVNDMSYLNTKEAKENWRKSIDMEALIERTKAMGVKNRKPVEVFLNGKSVGKFKSCSAAADALPIGLSSVTNLANPNHKTKEVYGYTVKYIKK